MLAQESNGLAEQGGNDGAAGGTSGPGRKITAAGLLTLLESQGYRCALTGIELTPDVASLDHAVPLSRGGSNTIENSQIVHKNVNQAKSTMTTEEFIALCIQVAAFCKK